MNTKVLLVTPDMASNWLTMNKNNRKVLKERVREYAQAMLAGRWSLTHQGIAFDTAGNLLDGQHRLMAIVMAGIPIEMNVTFGVEHKDGEVLEIDVGRNRTYKNIVEMTGNNDRVFMTMNGPVTVFLRFKMGAIRAHVPTYIITDYIERHYDEVAFTADAFHYTQGKRHAPALVTAAGLSALYGHENKDAIQKFGQVWCTNDTSCSSKYNVKIALDFRDRARTIRTSAETLNMAENAIRGFANNLRIVRNIDCYKLDKTAVL